MKHRKFRYFVGDFETTVYEGQTNTEVWASASVELYTEDVSIFHSIDEQYKYFVSLGENIVCYYHNLKFDGSFWLSYLLKTLKLKQAYTIDGEDISTIKWMKTKDMPNNSFSYSISNMGQWYRISIKHNNKIIEFRDSMKLLPFSVKRIGQSFNTKHQKLDMEYTGYRYAGCEITDDEKKYIANDVLVVKEAIEMMFNEGHNKLTIGSCCLAEYKKSIGNSNYKRLFPNLYEIPINEERFGSKTAGDYIKNSYHGGWCYLVKGKENKIFTNGTTADVNSLYPSMMSSESFNSYPIGTPKFWKGNFIPSEVINNYYYYFIRIKTRFKIKENKLPFIQIKNSLMYRATEMLETSDILDRATGKYYSTYIDFDGSRKKATVIMTMSMTDFKLFQEHYDLTDFEILDGCWFYSSIGLFDEYIEKYKKIKVESKYAKRELAKLFLNNLYGKMASSKNSSFKVAFLKPDNSLGFYTIVAEDKIPGYIAVGSAITSYARNFTIRAAQLNYHGVDERGFIYADTDSIHCDLPYTEIVGIKEDPKKFCCWKLESSWDEGIYVRQKTYIEHITHEDKIKIDNPYYNVRCAGMPEKCKSLFVKSITEYQPKDEDELTDEEKEFIAQHLTLKDFTIGLSVPGKLLPKQIDGGTLLVETSYKMRER